jgi:Uma2 family endonuclease
MATESVSNESLAALPPELRPNVEHLVTEDDTPVDNLFSEKQQRLLAEPLYTSWPGPGDERPFLVMANVGLFYALEQPPFVPDILLSLDVRCPADLWPKAHRSYFLWQYGKPPDAIVEVVSNRKGGEDTDKLIGYARIRIPYYAIFDPERLLSDDVLRVYELVRLDYRPLEDHALLPGIGLGLRIWNGSYEGHDNTWLRWIDAKGQLIRTGSELAEHAVRRAESAEQQAESAEQRAAKLAEQLKRLGVDPET